MELLSGQTLRDRLDSGQLPQKLAIDYAIQIANLFDKIHKDPRWLPFLRKLGKAPEQLAKIEFKVTLPK